LDAAELDLERFLERASAWRKGMGENMGEEGVDEGWRVEKANVRGLGGMVEEELGLVVMGNPV
jgi:hypothetical protein